MNPFSSISSPISSKILHRVGAKLIDLALVVAFAIALPYPLGPLAGFAYSLAADGLSFGGMRGQSAGKRLFKLQTRSLARNEPVDFRDSVVRNAPVGVATFFAIIPVWGWLILMLVGLPLMAVEIYLMLTTHGERRLGDVMADTEVIEFR